MLLSSHQSDQRNQLYGCAKAIITGNRHPSKSMPSVREEQKGENSDEQTNALIRHCVGIHS